MPDSPSSLCILPDLPVRYFGHTQHGGTLCGGLSGTQTTCRQWNSKDASFPAKPVHEFKSGRFYHVSWTPVSEKETFLIGGGFKSNNSSTIVEPEVLEGSPGFPIKYPLTRWPVHGSCGITDPDTDALIITGGMTAETDTSLYDENGFIEPFGTLNHKRRWHGCTSYVTNKKRVYLKSS